MALGNPEHEIEFARDCLCLEDIADMGVGAMAGGAYVRNKMQVPGAAFWIARVGFGVRHPNIYIVSNILLVDVKILGNGRRLTSRKGDGVLVDTDDIARLEYAS